MLLVSSILIHQWIATLEKIAQMSSESWSRLLARRFKHLGFEPDALNIFGRRKTSPMECGALPPLLFLSVEKQIEVEKQKRR
jgi:hypothetical protein